MSNPFRYGAPGERSPPPLTLTIFGASGDLTRRKLIPALWDLSVEGHLPRLAVVGCGRSPLDDDVFRDDLKEGIRSHARHPLDDNTWASFARSIHYHPLAAYDDREGYRRLRLRLQEVEADHGLSGNRLYYVSTPPGAFSPIAENLGAADLAREEAPAYARVIVEKPFGVDLGSARDLNSDLQRVFNEKQIYRIDHYLGKETVQNLLVFRFSNGLFEPLWNARYVDHVQITGAETLGVEGRGGYFDQAGILRDMVQNHLLQVLALAAMEPPASFDADAVRTEKTKVLQALRPVSPDSYPDRVVRGQYTSGSVLGQPVVGYREESGTDVASQTETSVALELFVDNWRWAGVPFYLRSGKRMPKKVTEIAVFFRAAPHSLFGPSSGGTLEENVLAFRIQPDEGIALQLGTKIPGPALEIAQVNMEFRYASSFGVDAPEAYERLLLDAMDGDRTLFTRADEVEASWRFVTPIHEAWAGIGEGPEPYEAGSWGPEGADRLIEKGGRRWRRP